MSSDNIFQLRRTTQPHSLESLMREQTEAALNKIIAIMNSPTASDRDRLTAAFALLDYGWAEKGEINGCV